MTDKIAVTLPGTVEKIIPPIAPALPEKAQIRVDGAEHLYQEIRIENKLQDEAGNTVTLKKGAEVEVTIAATPEADSFFQRARIKSAWESLTCSTASVQQSVSNPQEHCTTPVIWRVPSFVSIWKSSAVTRSANHSFSCSDKTLFHGTRTRRKPSPLPRELLPNSSSGPCPSGLLQPPTASGSNADAP